MNSINIDLFGWDTTYAISFTKANKAIKDLKTSPITFAHKSTNKAGIVTASIEGQWGDWMLTTKGGSQNVVLQCPIVSGSFSDLMDGSVAYPLDNKWVEVEIELNFIQQGKRTYFDPTAKEASGTQHNLLPRVKSSNSENPVASIIATNFSFPDANDPEITISICKGLFTEWMLENLNTFSHIFSTFILNEKADKDNFSWLKPTDLEYAVSSTDSLDTSVFAVMAMTEGRPIGFRSNSVDGRILQVAKAESAFAITGERYAEKWLLPACLSMHLGSTVDDYNPIGDGRGFTNINAMQWATFKDKDGNPVPAMLDAGAFRISLEESVFKVEMTNLHWEYQPGVNIHINYSEFFSLELRSGVDKLGKPYRNVLMAVPTTKKPSIQMTTTTEEWKAILDIAFEIVIAILGSILGGALGSLGDGVVEGAANGVIDGVEEGAEQSSLDLSDAIDELSSEAEASMTDEEIEIAEQEEQALLDDTSEDMEDANNDREDGEDPETIKQKFAKKVTSLGKKLKANRWKIAGTAIGAGVGATIGAIPKIVEIVGKEHYSELPDLNEFGENCVGAVKWPNATGFELQSAQLAGALILGGQLIEEKKSPEVKKNIEVSNA